MSSVSGSLGNRGIQLGDATPSLTSSQAEVASIYGGRRGVAIHGLSDDDDSDLGPRGCIAHDVPPLNSGPTSQSQTSLLPLLPNFISWFRPNTVIQQQIISALDSTIITRQKKVVNKIKEVSKYVLGATARPCTNRVSESLILNVNSNHLNEYIDEFAATSFNTAILQIESFFESCKRDIDDGKIKLLVSAKLDSDDETSLIIRASDIPASAPLHGEVHELQQARAQLLGPKAEVSNCIGKILQSRADVGFLFLNLTDGIKFFRRLRVPTTIQLMDHNTGEALRECTLQRWQLPSLDRLIACGESEEFIQVDDRAGSNNRRELSFLGELQERQNRLRVTCEVHKGQQSQGTQFACVQPLLSGVVNFGLSMMQGGSRSSLKSALRFFFEKRVRIYRGAYPPDGEHREMRDAFFDLFLSGTDMMTAQRRVVLKRMLNGYVVSYGIVQHFCAPGCCENEKATMDIFFGEVVDCLLPADCPILNRSKWMNAAKPVDYLGLLCLHGMFDIVVQPWLRALASASSPVTSEDFSEAPGLLEDATDDELLRIASEKVRYNFIALTHSGDVFDVADRIGIARVEPQQSEDALNTSAAADVDGKVDYTEFNRQVRTKTLEMAKQSPGDLLIITKVCMVPCLDDLMAPLLHVASEEAALYHAVSLDDTACAPAMSLATGKLLERFLPAIRSRLTEAQFWKALPYRSRTSLYTGLSFRLLSAAGGSASMLQIDPSKTYPWIMFLLLTGDQHIYELIKDDLDCKLDEWSKRHRARFPGEKLRSDESLNILMVVMVLLLLEIVRIEKTHAQVRRATLRAVQTTLRSMHSIGSDTFLLFQRIFERGAFDNILPGRRNAKRAADVGQVEAADQPKRKKRRRGAFQNESTKRGGCSSSWKVFMEENVCVGLWTKDKQALQTKYYQQMSDPIERQRLQTAAKLKTVKLKSRRFLKRHGVSITSQRQGSFGSSLVGVAQVLARTSRPQGEHVRSMARNLGESLDLVPVLFQKIKEAGAKDSQATKQHNDRLRKVARASVKSSSPIGGGQVVPALACASFAVSPKYSHSDFNVVDVRFASKTLVESATAKMRGPQRAEVSQQFKKRFEFVRHDSCPPLGKIRSKLKICFVACRCLCAGDGRQLRLLSDQFCKLLSIVYPAPVKKYPRMMLKRGEVVVRILCVSEPALAPCWFHIATVNLRSWEMRLLPLERANDIEDPAVVVLQVISGKIDWLSTWDALDYIDLGLHWEMDFWVISGQHSVKLPAFIPGEHVEVRSFSSSQALWNGRLLPKKVLRADRDDCPVAIMDVGGEDEEGEGGDVRSIHDDDSVSEDFDDVPDDEPPGTPPVPDSGVVPPPGPDILAGAEGRGRGGAPRRRGRGRGAAGKGGRNNNLSVDVPCMDDATVLLGKITVNINSKSLDVCCYRCNATLDRKFTERPDRHEANQGRPMGSHLCWLQFACGGDIDVHRAMWSDIAMPLVDRLDCREWGVASALFGDCFKEEREPWGREDQDPDHVA
jgi:hypothetical protein